MIHGRVPAPHGGRKRHKAGRPFRDRMFLVRLLFGLGMGLAACMLLFLGPALYFVGQNYDVFISLAYDVRPGLVHHLEREMMWLRLFLVAGALGTFAVCLFFGHRLMKHLLTPLEEIEEHIKVLTHGDWSKPAPEIPSHDVDRGFFLTYDYFHRSLRANAESELRMLERLMIDPGNREAYNMWRTLISNQRSRLGLNLSDSSASSSEAELLRRVS